MKCSFNSGPALCFHHSSLVYMNVEFPQEMMSSQEKNVHFEVEAQVCSMSVEHAVWYGGGE